MNPNALPLITYRTPTTASAAKRLEQLQSELVLLLETPGYVPFEVENDTWSDLLAYARNARIVGRMLDAEVNAAEQAGRVGKASEYSLASVRLGSSISRGGMLHHWSVGVAIEDPGSRGLADLRDRITLEQSKSLLKALQQINATREPLRMILARTGFVGDFGSVDPDTVDALGRGGQARGTAGQVVDALLGAAPNRGRIEQ